MVMTINWTLLNLAFAADGSGKGNDVSNPNGLRVHQGSGVLPHLNLIYPFLELRVIPKENHTIPTMVIQTQIILVECS